MMLIMFVTQVASADSNLGIEDRAQSYLIGDFESGQILEEFNIKEPVSVASVSKLMTFLCTKDALKSGKIKLEDRVTITKEMEEVGGSNFGLVEGEVLTVDQLLQGLMVVSGNDSAFALACKVAGNEAEFVKIMNAKAQEIGLKNSKFFNSSGLQEGQNQNTMTTEEIFLLAKHIIKEYPEVLEYSKTRVLSMPERNFSGHSTLPLVGDMPGVDGLKTGFTEEAGYCLVSTIDAKKTHVNGEFRLITIVMGTANLDERRDLSKFLLEYGLENYAMRMVIESNVPYTEIKVNSAKNINVPVYPSEDYKLLSAKGQKYVYKSTMNDDIQAPIEEGTKLGELTVSVNDKEIKTVDLVVKNKIEKASFFARLMRGFESAFSKILGLLK